YITIFKAQEGYGHWHAWQHQRAPSHPWLPFSANGGADCQDRHFGVDRIRSASVQPDFPRPLLAESVMGRKAAD
ncbi:hypothetical protein MCOR03_006981, partial [Pyricularia oryzae]